MQAKVRADSKLKVITACSGVNFNQRDWFEVPTGREEEALNNPFLETRLDAGLVEQEQQPVDFIGEPTTEKEIIPAPPVPRRKKKEV